MNFDKIKCFFGKHNYKKEGELEVCTICEKRLMTITVMTYEDAKKAGFTEEQLKKGYVTPSELEK
ncbi:hypothetical protein N9948_01600 [bacterium]|nr:hypothetical protein [bacterium]